MALITMKCKSCGASLSVTDGYCVCPYCGSVYFRLVENVCVPDAETISLAEFENKVICSSKKYYLNCKKGVVSDADANLTNSKITAAEKALDDFKLYKIADILKDVPADNFTAARIRLLCAAGVRNENELCLYCGDLKKLGEYDAFLSVCDDYAKAVYKDIEEKCIENAKTANKIKKGYEYLRIGETESGLRYAKELISFYPYNARAWELLIVTKCAADKDYDPACDLEKLKACPDFPLIAGTGQSDVYGTPIDLSPTIRERCRTIKSARRLKATFFYKYLLKPLLVLIAVGTLIGIWKLIELLVS